MIQKISKLDDLGFYELSDRYEKLILSQYQINKRRRTPEQKLKSTLNMISNQINDLQNAVNETSGGESEDPIIVEKEVVVTQNETK